MPRTPIAITDTIDYLAILDAEGRVDPALEPELVPDFLLKLHRFMLLGRLFDQRLLALQRQGRIGTFPPITGQEAAHLGAVAALKESDWMVPAFRETAAELWRGRPMESVILANNGYNEGHIVAPDRKDLPMSVPVGSQVLHALGLAWAAKSRGTDEVVMCFFGDGATSEGDFHEGLNMAGVYQAPVIFVCQNNQWAISIPRKAQTRSATIAQKAIAYGIAGIQVDGNDILAVHTAAAEAVARARAGQGPTLIEAVTYRMMMHTTADDPKRYRTEEEVALWQSRDPLTRFEVYLKSKGLLDDAASQRLTEEIQGQIQTAVDNAEAQMKTLGDPLDMFNHVFATLPDHLRDQKRALAEEIAQMEKARS